MASATQKHMPTEGKPAGLHQVWICNLHIVVDKREENSDDVEPPDTHAYMALQ